MAAYSVALQAVVFLALAWAYRFAARLILEAAAHANGDHSSAVADGIAAAVVVALDLFCALAVGFFGARWLLRAIVRATPHPMKPPTRPIAWVALSAAGVVVAFMILSYAYKNEPLSVPWFGWAFELLRDAAIVALFWIAAIRVVRPRVRR
jgi:hypothetical protein